MKNFLAIALLFILATSFVLAASYQATVIFDDSPINPVSKLAEFIVKDKSVLYYVKLLNANLISYEEPVVNPLPSAEEVVLDAKQSETKPVLSDAPKATVASAGATVSWTNLLGTQDNILVFPKVNVSNKDYVLKVNFTKSKWSGIKYLKVYINDSPVKCYYDVWGSLWNAFGESNALVYGWGEKKETCDYSISNQFVVTTTLSSNGDYYSMDLTSPIIPSSCNGKSITQSQVTTNASC